MAGKKRVIASTFIVGIVVIAAIVLFVGPEELLRMLTSARGEFLALAFVMQVGSTLALYARWNYIIRSTGAKFSSWQLFLISFSGNAVNSITPASRAGCIG